MKTTYSIILLLVNVLIFSSCAKNIVVNYANPAPNSGNIVIKPTSHVYANLTINDSLIVNYKNVKSITIKNVPEGISTIHFSAESTNLKEEMDKKIKVDITRGKTNTQLVTVPPKSNGYWFSSAVSTLGLLFMLIYIY